MLSFIIPAESSLKLVFIIVNNASTSIKLELVHAFRTINDQRISFQVLQSTPIMFSYRFAAFAYYHNCSAYSMQTDSFSFSNRYRSLCLAPIIFFTINKRHSCRGLFIYSNWNSF